MSAKEQQMAARRHLPAERERHLARVASLHARRMTQQAIADELDCSRSQISYDVGVLRKRWRAASMHDINETMGVQLATLDEIERESWAAWQASKAPYAETLTERAQGLTGRTRATLRRHDQHGDPDYMRSILSSLQERNKLLGLYPAEQRDVHLGGTMGLSLEVLQRIAQEADEEDATIRSAGGAARG